MEKQFEEQPAVMTEILSTHNDNTVQWYYTKIFGTIVKQALKKDTLTFTEVAFIDRLVCRLRSEDKLKRTLSSH